ncbi:hypothetical protein [Streptomyces sp. NPDC006477]|uniref:hypothetical protein n=1 Tax=Streptomyces sp. NPDC006477 TaxID=3364747 RepID=UPI0036CC720C
MPKKNPMDGYRMVPGADGTMLMLPKEAEVLTGRCENNHACKDLPAVEVTYSMSGRYDYYQVTRRLCQTHGTKFSIHAPHGAVFRKLR